MSRLDDRYDDMPLGDFGELLADKPRDEKWDLVPAALDLSIPLAEIYRDVLSA